MSVRRRLSLVLFGGSALGTIGHLAAVSVTSIAAAEIMGSARWAGVPAAAATLGGAIGAGGLGTIMERKGRRSGLVGGMALATGGLAVATIAVLGASIVGLVGGMFMLGFGRAAVNLARYAAADLQPEERRGSAISWMVWAGTFGSVIGPQLLGPGEVIGDRFLGTGLAGPFLVAAVIVGGAAGLWFALLRPDPATVVADGPTSIDGSPPVSTSSLLSRPNVWAGMAAMWLGQYVMVQVMAMTPVFLSSRGETLALVGQVISVHTLGMFAFSPVTGWLITRTGPRPIVAAGSSILVAAAALGWIGSDGALAVLYPALFLLGLGWNFCFVAGSTLLVEGLRPGEGVALQGWADTGTWIAGGLANVTSGVILAAAGFATLNLIAGGLAVVPLVALAAERQRRSLAPSLR